MSPEETKQQPQAPTPESKAEPSAPSTEETPKTYSESEVQALLKKHGAKVESNFTGKLSSAKAQLEEAQRLAQFGGMDEDTRKTVLDSVSLKEELVATKLKLAGISPTGFIKRSLMTVAPKDLDAEIENLRGELNLDVRQTLKEGAETSPNGKKKSAADEKVPRVNGTPVLPKGVADMTDDEFKKTWNRVRSGGKL